MNATTSRKDSLISAQERKSRFATIKLGKKSYPRFPPYAVLRVLGSRQARFEIPRLCHQGTLSPSLLSLLALPTSGNTSNTFQRSRRSGHTREHGPYAQSIQVTDIYLSTLAVSIVRSLVVSPLFPVTDRHSEFAIPAQAKISQTATLTQPWIAQTLGPQRPLRRSSGFNRRTASSSPE